MTQTIEISKAEWMAKYSRRSLEDPIIINLDAPIGQFPAGQIAIARTTEGQANNPDSYIIVFCVV